MVQENESRALEAERRVELMERAVAQRLGNIDAGLQQALSQVREGDFVRRILRAEIQKIISEQVAEEEQEAEKERIEQFERIRSTRRRRISYVLAGVLMLGGAAIGWKTIKYPHKSFSEALQSTEEDIRNQLSEMVHPSEHPPQEGHIKIWVSPQEAESIEAKRRQWQKIQELTQQLTRSQLQYQGWQAEPEENSRREASLEYWERQIRELENEIRNTWSQINEKGLQPAPEPVEDSTALKQS